MVDIWQIARETIKGEPFRVRQMGSGNANSIMLAVLACQAQAQEQTREFSRRIAKIYGRNIMQLLRDLYWAICQNVALKYDPLGVQLVRKPSNVVAEQACDCKSYSLFISAVLANLGVKNIFRFVSFAPGREVTHVFIVAYPGNGQAVPLDCNLRQFGREAKYYKKIDRMARICAIGKLPDNKAVWRDGRRLAQMSEPELGLRLHIDELKSELNLKHVKQQPALANDIKNRIAYERDLLKTVQAATDNGGAYLAEAPALIGAIEHDWRAGRYKTLTRSELLQRRAQEWDNGTRYYSDSNISGWLKDALKKTGKALKTFGKTVGNAVVKTVKATGQGIVSSVKLAADITKMATIAPVAALSSKGRDEIKKTANAIVDDVKDQGKAIKTVTFAPVSTLVEEVLDNMKEAGPYFLYYYIIPENQLANFPAKVQEKWKKQKKTYDRIINYVDVDKSKLNSIIRESIQRQWGHTPEEVFAALLEYQKAQNDKKGQIGELFSAATLAVIETITAIVGLASAVVGLILKIIGAIKSDKDLEKAGADVEDWSKKMNALQKSLNGAKNENGEFDFNKLTEQVLGDLNKDTATNYNTLLNKANDLLNQAKNKEATDYYQQLVNMLQTFKNNGADAMQTKISNEELIKLVDVMAAKDGITEQWNSIKGNLGNLDDVAETYKQMLNDQYTVQKLVELTDGSTSGTTKLDDIIKSPNTSAASATVNKEAAGTASAKFPWWVVVAGGCVVGALALSKTKKNKKNKKNKR